VQTGFELLIDKDGKESSICKLILFKPFFFYLKIWNWISYSTKFDQTI